MEFFFKKILIYLFVFNFVVPHVFPLDRVNNSDSGWRKEWLVLKEWGRKNRVGASEY